MTDSNGGNRDDGGRFAPGNPGGPGNPRVRALAAHQQAIADALTPEDVAEVMRALHRAATSGDMFAAKVLLDRIGGRVPVAPLFVDVGSVGQLRHGDEVADLLARVIVAAATGQVDLSSAERLAELLKQLGTAREDWGQVPSAMLRDLRCLEEARHS